jgi:hypothetical protein
VRPPDVKVAPKAAGADADVLAAIPTIRTDAAAEARNPFAPVRLSSVDA